MAPSGSSEGDISTLQEMLSIPRAQATTLLEKYINVERAVNQYFEDPVSAVKPQMPQNQWEPSDNLPSFHIEADDSTELTGMSRPPSRIDNRVGDIGGNRIQAEAGMPTPEEMLDPEMQRAIAMSRQDMSTQETGVVDTPQQFGPANRTYYDANQWAMTTISSSREIVDHPPPSKRQRLAGQPAFLRGSSETGYLAPLLNIYHNIPLAREAFLLPSMRVHSYGHDPQWWSGSSDENTKSISIDASDRRSQDGNNFLAELQCLMAFLDGTTRAYGSVDALADLRAMKMHNSETQLSRLLETWVAAAMIQCPDEQLTQVFTSTAMKAPDFEGSQTEQKDLVCLEPPVRRVEGQTLIHMLDSTIWDDSFDKIDDIWIHQCAEIFTMRLYDPNQEKRGLGLEIPAVWYPDRYMYEYREITRQWRREMLALRHEINQCALIQRRCDVAQGPGKRVIKIREVLEAASKLAETSTDIDKKPTHAEQESDGSTSGDEDPKELRESTSTDFKTHRAKDIQTQLQAILERIDEKTRILEQRKIDLFNQIRSIATQLTQPTLNSSLSPRYKYYLQGISTRPNITYLRRWKHEPQTLIDTTDEAEDSEFQWWRIVWGKDERVLPPTTRPLTQQEAQESKNVRNLLSGNSVDEEQAYAVHMVEEDEVIEAAKTESNSIVLVYANENAMNFKPGTPNAALRKFVEQDNRTFYEELRQERNGTQRRYSQDTNTTIMEEIPFEDRSVTPNNLREMTPMSMTSPQRDADGQPSPKRAKADEAYQVYRELDSSEDEPPSYEESSFKPPMQEKKVNKIGMLADQMLEKYGGNSADDTDADGPVHIEHAREPLR